MKCCELTIHLDRLQAIPKATTDVVNREGLEGVVIYLGNRLATLAEPQL